MAIPSSTESHRPLANAPDVDQLVDTKTAAKVLGLRNHHTLEVWRSTQRHQNLRFFRVGRAIRYRLSDLTCFLQSNAVGGAPVERGSAVKLGEAR